MDAVRSGQIRDQLSLIEECIHMVVDTGSLRKAMSTYEKAVTVVKDNKYKILIGTWLGSIYGTWTYVESNKLMDATKKAATIKKVNVGSTVVFVLALASCLLNERLSTASRSPKSDVNK